MNADFLKISGGFEASCNQEKLWRTNALLYIILQAMKLWTLFLPVLILPVIFAGCSAFQHDEYALTLANASVVRG